MTVPSFHPAPKAGTLALIVSEHFKRSILCSYLHPHSSSAHIFVPVLWLSILLVGNTDKLSQKCLGKKTMIISNICQFFSMHVFYKKLVYKKIVPRQTKFEKL